MSINRSPFRKSAVGRSESPSRSRRQQTSAEPKRRQSAKIRELKEVLVAAGIITLQEQAKALGLSRSTAWTILKGNHKASGITAKIINRILAGEQLPSLVRTKVLEYVEEKAAGCYGHGEGLRRRFVGRLSIAVEKMITVRPGLGIGIASTAHTESYPRPRRLAHSSAHANPSRKPNQRRSTRL